ncbi:hypothetical protein ACP70R_028488 [Stipagrostis hirtigluma subsp. patula]
MLAGFFRAGPWASSATQTPIEHVVVVVEPEWAGGMLDCGGDVVPLPVVHLLRLRVEHGEAGVRQRLRARRALLCFAPLWVFGVSALRIHDYVTGGAGVLLCVFGLLYGGYWRIQTRRRFGLPGSGRTTTDGISLGDGIHQSPLSV